MREVRCFGVVGTGVIGAGWAARALSRGLDVVAWDPATSAEDKLRAQIDNAWPALTKLGLSRGANRQRLAFTSDLESLCGQADFIQENAPENEDLKRDLHARLTASAPAEMTIRERLGVGSDGATARSRRW